MKALTISQPYASLIADGKKFVENRTWMCRYTGSLAIHAGKGTQYLSRDELRRYPSGAIVAVCRVTGCLFVPQARASVSSGVEFSELDSWTLPALRRIVAHEHTEGPYGIVLQDVVKLDTPIPVKGAQGLWNVPKQFTMQLEHLLAIPF